jgi:hypothetical protein
MMTVAAVEIIYNKSYQCGFCISRMAETVREKKKNCTGKAVKPTVKELDVFKFTLCPGNFYASAYGSLVDVHRQFRKGVLVNEGGLLDQPTKYIDMMNLIENLISQKEIDAMKESAKNGKRKQSIR